MGGPHAGAGEECEEEGEAEKMCDELITAPTPRAPVPLRGGDREIGSEVSPERREGWGEGVLRFGFISPCPTLILTGNQLN